MGSVGKGKREVFQVVKGSQALVESRRGKDSYYVQVLVGGIE